ncbi:hypothetical protein IFM89_031586 [Coptis chinensis]|uniref:Uncharacterized protein n=1 Tax=Coptis chinensis TaxID=261450 RepID=A0A835HZ48_9MAGN|nr:hypothetical protein IFM89_031586 [Coptis chinensis]
MLEFGIIQGYAGLMEDMMTGEVVSATTLTFSVISHKYFGSFAVQEPIEYKRNFKGSFNTLAIIALYGDHSLLYIQFSYWMVLLTLQSLRMKVELSLEIWHIKMLRMWDTLNTYMLIDLSTMYLSKLWTRLKVLELRGCDLSTSPAKPWPLISI